MSMSRPIRVRAESVFEYNIVIESFKNLDLRKQGLYRICCQVFTAPPVKSLIQNPQSQNEDDFVKTLLSSKQDIALPYQLVKGSLPLLDPSPYNLPPPAPIKDRKSQIITGYDMVWDRITRPTPIATKYPSTSNSVALDVKKLGPSEYAPNSYALPEDDIILDIEDEDVELEDNLESRLNSKGEFWGGAQIDVDGQYFATQAVHIQFCDQMVIMNDSCLFRLCIPLESTNSTYISIELQHADPPPCANGNAPAPTEPTIFEWNTVGKRVLAVGSQTLMSNSKCFTAAFSKVYPILFDHPSFFSRANVIIHSCLLETKFRALSWSEYAIQYPAEYNRLISQEQESQNSRSTRSNSTHSGDGDSTSSSHSTSLTVPNLIMAPLSYYLYPDVGDASVMNNTDQLGNQNADTYPASSNSSSRNLDTTVASRSATPTDSVSRSTSPNLPRTGSFSANEKNSIRSLTLNSRSASPVNNYADVTGDDSSLSRNSHFDAGTPISPNLLPTNIPSNYVSIADFHHTSLIEPLLLSYSSIAQCLSLCQDLMTPDAHAALQDYMSVASAFQIVLPRAMLKESYGANLHAQIVHQQALSEASSPSPPMVAANLPDIMPGPTVIEPRKSVVPISPSLTPAVSISSSVKLASPRRSHLSNDSAAKNQVIDEFSLVEDAKVHHDPTSERDKARIRDGHVIIRRLSQGEIYDSSPNPGLDIDKVQIESLLNYKTVPIAMQALPSTLPVPLPVSRDILESVSKRFGADRISPDALAIAIQSDLSHLSRQCFALWNVFVHTVPFVSRRLRRVLLRAHRLRERDRIGGFIYANSNAAEDLLTPFDPKLDELRNKLTSSVRRASSELVHDSFIEDVTVLYQCFTQQHTVVFEDSYVQPMASDVNESKSEYPTPESNSASKAILKFPNLGTVLEGDLDISTYFSNVIQEEELSLSPNKGALAGASIDYMRRLPSSLKGEHLVVMCHGYQGSPGDMRRLKNLLRFWVPKTHILVSKSNLGRTDESIRICGARLAEEITDAFKEHKNVGRLSFVGHSMGGLIIRSALKEPCMRPYLDKLFTFVTLASPHAGYMFSSHSALVSTGMWFLRKWNTTPSLDEMSFADKSTLEQCVMYKMSEAENCMLRFRHIFLFASRQDKYVPFHSSRIEIGYETDSRMTVYKKIIENLLTVPRALNNNNPENVSATTTTGSDSRLASSKKLVNAPQLKVLKRFDVVFKEPKRDVNSFIGRTAHIEFLENVQYFQMFMSRYWKAFL